MSDIKVGDLVQCVAVTKCGCAVGLGSTFTVETISKEWVECADCHAGLGQYLMAKAPDGKWFGLYRLKRIPPLGELEGEKRDEEVTA